MSREIVHIGRTVGIISARINLCCDDNTSCARKAGVPAQVDDYSKGILLYIIHFLFFLQLRNVFLFLHHYVSYEMLNVLLMLLYIG